MVPKSRPRIACYHGGGSSSAIYEVQCDQLIRSLPEFEFHFFDAPFLRNAGPGVLPAFDMDIYRPYRTWFLKQEDGTELEDGREGGDWVGAMGFSQGTRVVGGLLLDQQRRKEAGLSFGKEMVLKFGVLCMGGAAPMVSAMSRGGSMELDKISIPTLHLHGLKDQNLENGRKQLAMYYDPKKAKLWEIDYHHAMPWYKADVADMVTRFRQISEYSKEVQ
ncbi:serine hydrolase FSH [Halenospora varia]|nr:serine hydrolase FSH [Halenospora varia]